MSFSRHIRITALFLVLCGWLVAAPLVAAPAQSAAPAVDSGTALDIQEITLDNGLRIFVLERSTSPTFAAMYQFGVGGASDPKGRSGIAHLLEHMMFKGTKNVGTVDPKKESQLMARLTELWQELHAELDAQEDPFRSGNEKRIAELKQEIEKISAEQKKMIVKNEYDELMTRAGSVGMNASTNYDVTRYYIQLPANRLEFWFDLEADRLLNPVFREFYSERDVVYEERRMRTENTPSGRAREALQTLMFTAHPYGTPVVGWPRDLQRLVREDAMDYFVTYYSPSNCIMALVGDVKAKEVERLAKKYFSAWKRQEIPRLPITTEPEQQGERRRTVEAEAEPQLSMAWMTVPEGHPDQYPLDVLALILGGLSSSRIDQTIVNEERLASSAGAFHPTYKYSGWLSAYGRPRGEHTNAELETAIQREISRIQADGVTADELERAKIRAEVSRVRSLKSNMGQAVRIANAVYYSGSLDYLEGYEERINAVTAEQVQEVAKTYLQPERKNVVEVIRKEGAGGGGRERGGVEHGRGGEVGERGARHSKGFGQAMNAIRNAEPVELKVPELGKDVQRVELDGGITVFIKEDRSAPSVSMRFSWLGGSNTTPVEDLAPFKLANGLLREGGTESLTPAELEAKRDELGMSFSLGIYSTSSGGSFWSLKRNFEDAFDLALEMLMRPRFDADRLETLKGQYIQRMKRRGESPGNGASILLSHVIFEDDPRRGYVPTREEIESVTPEQIRAFWKRYLGRDNLYISVVGDFEADKMLDLLRNRLSSWRTAEDKKRDYLAHEPYLKPGVFLLEKDVPQPAVRLYHQIEVDRRIPMADHAALEILNDILGGSGFRSRLMERLRSDEGLTYGIYSGLSHQGRPGVPGRISIGYQTKRDAVARSIDSVLEEFQKIIKEKVGEAEVEEQIEGWRNRFIFQYDDDAYNVSRLMYNELDDRPYDFDKQELDAVQKVTVSDVHRVAKKYLKPENLTIAIYGELTDADRKSLDDRFKLTTLTREEVFTGGYDEEPAQERPAAVR